jgi:hypothetical protein
MVSRLAASTNICQALSGAYEIRRTSPNSINILGEKNMKTKSRLLTMTFLATIILGGNISMPRSERSLLKSCVEQRSFKTVASLSMNDEPQSAGGVPPCLPGTGGNCLVGSSMPSRNVI